MKRLLNLLRRGPAEHEIVFSEFAILLVFVIADHLAAERKTPRLRVVR